ncbi:MAG TPA: four helix bundle protein [Gemmatimonadaceae bacterium]|nr:four helix bundle protein [Gemmatimonadaceae bacterium]
MSTHDSADGALGRVQAYTIARRLGTLAWSDSEAMIRDARLGEVASQLVRAVGSIAANVAEGYARRSRPDRIRFYEYALGSAAEALSWYETARPSLAAEVFEAREKDLVSLRRLLLVMIRNERIAKASHVPVPSSADNR